AGGAKPAGSAYPRSGSCKSRLAFLDEGGRRFLMVVRQGRQDVIACLAVEALGKAAPAFGERQVLLDAAKREGGATGQLQREGHGFIHYLCRHSAVAWHAVGRC